MHRNQPLELGHDLVDHVWHLVLTCDRDGKLGRAHLGRQDSLVVYMPERTNDSGFAMTSSLTSMLLSCLLLLGPRRGKYGPDGKPRAIPGHSMPLVGLGVLILWLGWFGFNGGSTLGTSGSRFAEVMLVTQLGAAAGVIGACLVTYFKTRSLDVGMAGNGAIAGLVGITAPSGYVEFWAAPIIGLVAGILVVYAFGVPALAWKTGLTLGQALAGSAVFLPGDIVKAVAAGLVCQAAGQATRSLLPGRA